MDTRTIFGHIYLAIPIQFLFHQIATYLSSRGWRVIAGCRSGGLGARLADSWLQAHIATTPDDQPKPRLVTLELDVAREDLLEEAARATAQHLPAGEHG